MGQFFRDVLGSETLREALIRPLLARRSAELPVRAWIIGCRDGREAHGLAIAVAEEADLARKSVAAKIFATDSSVESLGLARLGLFPADIEAFLSADRLAKFFERYSDGYRAKRSVRDRIIFARLDPAQDTPLSRIDIILCRLLLKDLQPDLRNRVREALLYALQAGGTLLLCPGDDLGQIDERLEALTGEQPLFRRTDNGIDLRRLRAAQDRSSAAPVGQHIPFPSRSPGGPLIRSALLELCPPTLVVDDEHRVIYVHGDVSSFIGYPPGPPPQDALELVRAPFRPAVRNILQLTMLNGRAITRECPDEEGGGCITMSAAPLRTDTGSTAYRLSFMRIGTAAERARSQAARRIPPADEEGGESSLRDRLQAVTEAFEATHEALAAANEELASSNEELQSANEALEASREDLQTANDGLSNANARLEAKVAALERAESRLSEALRTAEHLHSKAAEANRAKDEFISTVSHELRTPLNTIRLWSRLLANGKVGLSQVAEGARVIDRAVAAQRQLIDDLLDVSRMSAGQLRLRLRDSGIAAVVQSAIDAVRAQVESRQIELASVIDPDAGSLYVDADRIQQVIWNLLINAVKFTPEGGRIDVRLQRVGSVVEIEVRDTGVGIPPDFLPHVFERFRQRDGGITRRHGGLGLGLSIAKELVELHGGTISARSPGEGKGAAFLVRLPVVAHVEQHDTPPSRGAEPGAQDLGGVEVLVIEDEELTRNATMQLLAQHNARVRTASTAAQARAALEHRPRPDVIVADIGMPDEDGYRLLESVRRVERERHLTRVPAIAVTALAQHDDRERALAAGFDLHLAKPVDPDDLLEAIRQLGHREAQAPQRSSST